ncbi:MAG: hypothetical protein Q7T33_10790 [Dehalococcoidia bacterium]|nr:hypothetical protein [Dehalococcoidia bacterium]
MKTGGYGGERYPAPSFGWEQATPTASETARAGSDATRLTDINNFGTLARSPVQ